MSGKGATAEDPAPTARYELLNYRHPLDEKPSTPERARLSAMLTPLVAGEQRCCGRRMHQTAPPRLTAPLRQCYP